MASPYRAVLSGAKIIGAAALLAALLCFQPGAATAQSRPEVDPLTQADIDAYIFLLPRLARGLDSDQKAELLREAGLGPRRAAYVTAKIAVTQALVSGLLSSSQMTADQVSPQLHPSAEELTLVNDNLASLVRAQQAARQAAAQPPSQGPRP